MLIKTKMAEYDISLSKAENIPDPQTEDDIIDRLDAKDKVGRLFNSDWLGDREKAVLALGREDVWPTAVKGLKRARIQTSRGIESFGQLVNQLPGTGKLTQEEIGDTIGVSAPRVGEIKRKAARKARIIVNPPPAYRRRLGL